MEKKVFAKGYCFSKLFLFFLLGCLIGTYYEEILWFIRYKEITNRQGVIYGPFSPIYGVGVLIFVLLLGKKNDCRSIIKTFLYSCLIGGLTEYLAGFIADTFFGVKFWDYSDHILNIQGRTSVPFMLGWGVLGTILMKWIYPKVSLWIEKIPYKIGQPIYKVVLVFILLDIFITYSAFARMAWRNSGKEPFTPIGQLYDKIYTDEFMYQKFPIMRPKDVSLEK